MHMLMASNAACRAVLRRAVLGCRGTSRHFDLKHHALREPLRDRLGTQAICQRSPWNSSCGVDLLCSYNGVLLAVRRLHHHLHSRSHTRRHGDPHSRHRRRCCHRRSNSGLGGGSLRAKGLFGRCGLGPQSLLCGSRLRPHSLLGCRGLRPHGFLYLCRLRLRLLLEGQPCYHRPLSERPCTSSWIPIVWMTCVLARFGLTHGFGDQFDQ